MLAVSLSAVVTLSGCNTNLVHVRGQNASIVLSKYRSRPVAAVNGNRMVLTLHDCTRLALENNLDIQAQLWDEQVKRSLASSERLGMLPKVEGKYDLTQRDRPSFSRSDVLDAEGAFEVSGPGPGTGVTNFSTGRERSARAWNAQVKWSPVDAAMARYNWRIRRNESTYARYQRVRVAQQLVGTVGAAYYRLLALMECIPKAKALVADRDKIASDLRALAGKQLITGEEYLEAAAKAVEARNQLAQIGVDIRKQRELLASTMNVSPDGCFRLTGRLFPVPPPGMDPCKLEAAALVNRPEAYQADITFINSLDEQKRLMAKCFPRVEGFYGYFRDENKFVLNRNWFDGGVRISWDLMEFAADLLRYRAAQSKIAKTDSERSLISMGILSQVRLRYLDAVRAMDESQKFYELKTKASESLRIAKDREEVTERGAPKRIVQIARQRTMCDLLQAELDYLMSSGEVHAAMGNLHAAVGTNYSVATAHPQEGESDAMSPLPNILSRLLSPVTQAFTNAFGYF
ncbi:MAG: TolC family protein [Pseudomonadota bacterium]